jgi:hypothetical protein
MRSVRHDGYDVEDWLQTLDLKKFSTGQDVLVDYLKFRFNEYGGTTFDPTKPLSEYDVETKYQDGFKHSFGPNVGAMTLGQIYDTLLQAIEASSPDDGMTCGYEDYVVYIDLTRNVKALSGGIIDDEFTFDNITEWSGSEEEN